MSEKISIYGHEIDLEAQAGHVTDVIILAREVRYEDDGTMSDALLASTTRATTYMTQLGILEFARELIGKDDG